MVVVEFSDTRPKEEKERSGGREINFPDSGYIKPVPEMLSEIIAGHFNKSQGNKEALITPIKPSLITISNQGDFVGNNLPDYVLLGNTERFRAYTYDEYYGSRMAGSFIAGLTVVGMVFMPAIMAGDIDFNSEVDFDKVILVRVQGPQILWKGSAKKSNKESHPLTSDTAAHLLKVHTKNTQSAIQLLYNNISLSNDLGFPQKYSIEDSRKILRAIKQNGSMTGLSF